MVNNLVLAQLVRFGPTSAVEFPDEAQTKGFCFVDLFAMRAYMGCYTNGRDNTQCCVDAGVTGGEETDPGKKGCLALCDGTNDLPGRAEQSRISFCICNLA